jgi:hypothetical protein
LNYIISIVKILVMVILGQGVPHGASLGRAGNLTQGLRLLDYLQRRVRGVILASLDRLDGYRSCDTRASRKTRPAVVDAAGGHHYTTLLLLLLRSYYLFVHVTLVLSVEMSAMHLGHQRVAITAGDLLIVWIVL